MMKRGMPPLKLSAGRKNKRGVSPIIATILLVAITVVIAAVLYVLVSGYLKGTGGSPLTIQLANPSYAKSKGGTYFVNFSSVTGSSGMTTGDFGFKVVTVNGNTVTWTSATLINSAGVKVANFTAGGTSWDNTVSIGSGSSISFFMGASNTQGSGDTIQAFGLGSSSVSGGYSAGL
jgi:flagellin-like protein